MSQITRTDAVNGALVTEDWHNELVHLERVWVSGSTVIAVAAAGDTDFLLRVPDDGTHTPFTYKVTCTGQMDVVLYEEPGITAVGNARPPLNVYRGSAAVTGVLCYSESNIAAVGTYLDSQVAGAGGGKIGGKAEANAEWHGEVGYDYLVRVTTFAVNQRVTVTWRFHEEP